MPSRLAGWVVWLWTGVLGLAGVVSSVLSPSDEAVFILPALMTVILSSLVVTKVPGNRIGPVMLVGGSFTAELRDQLDPLGVVDGWVKVVSETMEPAPWVCG